MQPMMSEHILWEESHYSKVHLFKGLMFSAPGIMLCIFGIVYFSLGLLSMGFIFLVCPLLYIGGPRAFFFIKFTDSTLTLKRRYFGRTKKFVLSTIFKIEIEIYKRTEWYRSKPRAWFATLKFRINIFTASKEEKYSFYRTFFARKTSGFGRSDPEAKQKAIHNRTDFENNLRNLEAFFPNLIFVKDVAPPSKELGPGFWGTTICCISFLLLIILFSAFIIREDPYSIMVSIILYSIMIGLCITNAIYRYLKQKKRKKS